MERANAYDAQLISFMGVSIIDLSAARFIGLTFQRKSAGFRTLFL